jgi:hypothetical protein
MLKEFHDFFLGILFEQFLQDFQFYYIHYIHFQYLKILLRLNINTKPKLNVP